MAFKNLQGTAKGGGARVGLEGKLRLASWQTSTYLPALFELLAVGWACMMVLGLLYSGSTLEQSCIKSFNESCPQAS